MAKFGSFGSIRGGLPSLEGGFEAVEAGAVGGAVVEEDGLLEEEGTDSLGVGGGDGAVLVELVVEVEEGQGTGSAVDSVHAADVADVGGELGDELFHEEEMGNLDKLSTFLLDEGGFVGKMSGVDLVEGLPGLGFPLRFIEGAWPVEVA